VLDGRCSDDGHAVYELRRGDLVEYFCEVHGIEEAHRTQDEPGVRMRRLDEAKL